MGKKVNDIYGTKVQYLYSASELYPNSLFQSRALLSNEQIAYIGNINILSKSRIGFFCSSKCPGSIILKSHDLAQKWRERGVVVAGGFHSPVEQEAFTTLLRGRQPIIRCPARSIEHIRIPGKWRDLIENGRLLIVSPFKEYEKRPTVKRCLIRNTFVSDIAPELFIAHAEEKGKLYQITLNAIESGKTVYTFNDSHNSQLIAHGAKVYEI